MLIVKTHHTNDGRIVACVTDQEVCGKLYEEGKRQLDLRSAFYQGKPMTPIEAGDVVRNADMAHLSGKESILLGREEGILEDDSVIIIQGVPHAQIMIDH